MNHGQRGAREKPGAAYCAPNVKAKEKAEEYVAEVKDFDGSRRAWSALVKHGDRLLEAAGSVEEAAKSLWQVREELVEPTWCGGQEVG